jgi:hypothetical protein
MINLKDKFQKMVDAQNNPGKKEVYLVICETLKRRNIGIEFVEASESAARSIEKELESTYYQDKSKNQGRK